VNCSWVKFKLEEVKCSWVNCSEDVSNKASTNIRRYIDHMQFAACVAVRFITFFIFFWLHFVSLYVWLCCSVYESRQKRTVQRPALLPVKTAQFTQFFRRV
jgi:hypothetical protein